MPQTQRTAVFLDKDGTLLDDAPSTADPRRMRLSPGAAVALQRLGSLGVPLIVVSNQPGIGMGRIDESSMLDVERELRRMFDDCGATLTGFYYCPHHPEAANDAYRKSCTCRKPMPGLLLKAAANHGIDVLHSWMLGNVLDDVEAGFVCGCRTILLNTGNEIEWALSARRLPNYTVETLDAAADIIIRAHDPRLPSMTEDEDPTLAARTYPLPELSRLPQHPVHQRN